MCVSVCVFIARVSTLRLGRPALVCVCDCVCDSHIASEVLRRSRLPSDADDPTCNELVLRPPARRGGEFPSVRRVWIRFVQAAPLGCSAAVLS